MNKWIYFIYKYRFYLTHLHSLCIKHSNYISIYSIDETFPIFKM